AINEQPQNAVGFEELKQSLESIEPGEDAREIAEVFAKAKNAVIVFAQNNINPDAAKLIANLAVVTGRIGKARNGIIQLKPKANSQGLVDMGVTKGAAEIVKGMAEKSIKGLYIFGEDIAGIDLSSLDLLVVQDTHLTETAKVADIVLPAVSFAESEGTFTNAERRIQRLNQAITPIPDVENWEVLMVIANAFGANLDYCCPDCILDEIGVSIPDYKGIQNLEGRDVFWPVGGSPVLYGKGFNFEDGKAKLQVVPDGPLFKEGVTTDYLENTFVDFLKEKKIG
ncbi:MAG: molybdopterin-dependent oxidoreductase, partial [Desulfitobacteriaceae bacterium]|nr:molybdopterin-dependent oxidoreductase [Desulfitobacteriaceae bacterium]